MTRITIFMALFILTVAQSHAQTDKGPDYKNRKSWMANLQPTKVVALKPTIKGPVAKNTPIHKQETIPMTIMHIQSGEKGPKFKNRKMHGRK